MSSNKMVESRWARLERQWCRRLRGLHMLLRGPDAKSRSARWGDMIALNNVSVSGKYNEGH